MFAVYPFLEECRRFYLIIYVYIYSIVLVMNDFMTA